MLKKYQVTGMTCQGCVASVTEGLSKVKGVDSVSVNLQDGQTEVMMSQEVRFSDLQLALPEKFKLRRPEAIGQNLPDATSKTKFQQLRPLFLIFTFLILGTVLMNYGNWALNSAMLDFMGLFYIVFSFFKFLDLKGFPKSFKMYDPLAKRLPLYGWLYPFIELALAVLFLMRVQIQLALTLTIIILGSTTFGVVKTLLDKKSIQCACLGTALKLPMTEATFIENTIMLVMAVAMLFK